ncbi:MAG: S9 family peptidase [Candidatus Promineifilaceae bacterium]|nr:S9 family peptidase [Candidatus Promineifilaceae bacterium]
MSEFTFEQYAAVRNYADLSFSPDGRWLTYTTNASGQFNVWRQPVRPSPEAVPFMPIQLTALMERTARRAVWSPDGRRILTMADFHGTENYQLFEIPPGHGWLYALTDNPQARQELGPAPFSPDGSAIVYSSNEREPADLDLVYRQLDNEETRILLGGGGIYYGGEWAPDGQSLVGLEVHGNTNQDLYLVDVQTGEAKHLTPHEGDVRYLPSSWKPDGSGFYLVTDQGREYLGLAFYELASGQISWLETPEWDVEDVKASADGRFLAWVVNEDGYSELYVKALESDETNHFQGLPRGTIEELVFSPAEPLLAFYAARPTGPAELYVLDARTGTFWQLTQAFLGGIPTEELVEPELIRYESFDGRQIPAFLYKPKGLAAGEQAPLVLSIHGGPEAQERPGYNYNGLYQYLLHQGIGILATNIRGSTGYGKSYQKLIHRDWGGGELRDLDHAVNYLHALAWVDNERLGVFGGSFGGFATLSCVSRLPDYWAAAVDIFGPSNLITFTKNVPPHWRRILKQWVGDPEEDADMLRERSPLNYVENIRTPLLIVQGANDPRVVKAESDQMVEQLQEAGQTVEYMVFEDEGHGFSKASNRLKAFRAAADWLVRHLT